MVKEAAGVAARTRRGLGSIRATDRAHDNKIIRRKNGDDNTNQRAETRNNERQQDPLTCGDTQNPWSS